MGKLVKLEVHKISDAKDTWIDYKAYLVVVDEGEEFKVHQTFTINLDRDIDEEIIKIVEEAKAWISQSRIRLERAKQIAEKLGIPLEIVQE